jgi:hypothetical protein
VSTTVINKPRRTAPKPTAAPAPERRVVFISHANPDDNAAAGWFATQLTLLGYDVWCDIRNAHGGETEFWLKVQKTIENDAAKVVYILSNALRDLERKKGLYKELQAADNLRRDNFIVPVRIEKLSGSLPILISPTLYISAENWAAGLRDLVERLREDGVPRRTDIDFEKISSWWPALSVDSVLREETEEELVSNILEIKALPERIHFLRVVADSNPITGYDALRKVLPGNPAHYAHGDHAVTFAGPPDFTGLAPGFECETACTLDTRDFLASGHKASGIEPDIAHNIVTYLVGEVWDTLMASKNLSAKKVGRGRRAIWYVRDGLIPGNKAGVSEPGKRPVSIKLVGKIRHYRKSYVWHFGWFSSVDLRVHGGIILSPKAVLSPPYNGGAGEAPVPIDNKKALKALGWWNREWRQKLLAMLSWLSDGGTEIVIPTGYQQLVTSAQPLTASSAVTFREMPDDDVVNQTLKVILEHAPAP